MSGLGLGEGGGGESDQADSLFCVFFRDPIDCPEYESWKKAFLTGGYLPYENAKGGHTSYGSVSAGRENDCFMSIFFLKVEISCDQT